MKKNPEISRAIKLIALTIIYSLWIMVNASENYLMAGGIYALLGGFSIAGYLSWRNF